MKIAIQTVNAFGQLLPAPQAVYLDWLSRENTAPKDFAVMLVYDKPSVLQSNG